MNHGVVSFCTESMATRLLFLPYEMAPGHYIDLRDLHDAADRMKAATQKAKQTIYLKQMELF